MEKPFPNICPECFSSDVTRLEANYSECNNCKSQFRNQDGYGWPVTKFERQLVSGSVMHSTVPVLCHHCNKEGMWLIKNDQGDEWFLCCHCFSRYKIKH